MAMITTRSRRWLKGAGAVVAALLLLIAALMFYWDHEPRSFDPVQVAKERAAARGEPIKTGYVTVSTLMRLAETLLDKRGGYLTNDLMPPGVLMDNVPEWEFGVLKQVRDLTRSLRNDFSRSQTQSQEDRDLAIADPQFHIDSESWMFPPAEREYRKGIDSLGRYLQRLSDDDPDDAQFYARADNLRSWLGDVEKRLGSLSQRLAASVGRERINTDLAGDRSAEQSTPGGQTLFVKTPWMEIDNVFYEARGTSWALLHLLKAIEVDFQAVLQDKNALISLRQIIRELESCQEPVRSPMILSGSGFGIFTNHSLVLASYLTRANAGISELRSLLAQG